MNNFYSSSKICLSTLQKNKTFLVAAVVLTLALASISCISTSNYSRLDRYLVETSQPPSIDLKSPWLKAHMRDGSVYLLHKWKTDEEQKTLTGTGTLYNLNREPIKEGNLEVPINDVAIYETNTITQSPLILPLAILTTSSLGMSIFCLANPKACFGSCPTFYAWDGEQMSIQAEGFSASVCPALEKTDIDALYRTKALSQNLELRVTNEALETHMIRSARLLALPRPENGRVFSTPSGEFLQAVKIQEPENCTAEEGSIIEKVRFFDGQERYSETDPKDLATKETIDLDFELVAGQNSGLILGFRQTLLTTYLFYQGLAYMGSSSGYWLAKLEQDKDAVQEYTNGIGNALGGIEVFIQNKAGDWIQAGEIKETGPIATDIQIVPLPRTGTSPLKIRLRQTRGLWRLDYLALAQITRTVDPIRIEPSMVYQDGRTNHEALASLKNSSQTLITLPGDELTLVYELPSGFSNYELFIESQGYYLEWMRPDWLEEENLQKTIMMFKKPEKFMKAIAPEFKKVESQMEETFWRSRYVRK